MGRSGCVWDAVVVCGARWSCVGRGGHVVECRDFGRRDQGLKPLAAVSKLG